VIGELRLSKKHRQRAAVNVWLRECERRGAAHLGEVRFFTLRTRRIA
jgi:hypothetical protein